MVQARRRHLDVARQLRGGVARGRRRHACGRRGFDEKGRQCLRRHPAARPSCRNRAADGLLSVRQRRHRRALCAAAARRRPRGDRRFRRPSRQRLAGDFLGRQDGDVLLDPPDAAVSRHRRGHRIRRVQYRRQRAAAARRRRRGVPRRVREPYPAAAARVSAGADCHFRRLRRPHARSARQPQSGRGRFRLGDAKDHGRRRSLRRRPRRLAAGRRLRSARRWPTRPPRTSLR